MKEKNLGGLQYNNLSLYFLIILYIVLFYNYFITFFIYYMIYLLLLFAQVYSRLNNFYLFENFFWPNRSNYYFFWITWTKCLIQVFDFRLELNMSSYWEEAYFFYISWEKIIIKWVNECCFGNCKSLHFSALLHLKFIF